MLDSDCEQQSVARRPVSRLHVVGVGIHGPAHATAEAKSAIQTSSCVFSLVADPLSREWIRGLAPHAVSLDDAYAPGRPREESYEEMVCKIVAPLERGETVCAVFYGHPGVFAIPAHEAIRRARAAGHNARMYPGISADACLFADLGVDPGQEGCHTFEATDFLLRSRKFDPGSFLVLWQIGVIAVQDVRDDDLWGPEGLEILVEELIKTYPPEHEVVVYEAPTVPLEVAKIVRVPLRDLGGAPVTAMSTLLVPPAFEKGTDMEMARRLRMV